MNCFNCKFYEPIGVPPHKDGFYQNSEFPHGIQVKYLNGYGLSIFLYERNDTNPQVNFDNVSIVVFKRDSSTGIMSNKTLDIMQDMGYSPSPDEASKKVFTRISSASLAQIMMFVSKLSETVH